MPRTPRSTCAPCDALSRTTQTTSTAAPGGSLRRVGRERKAFCTSFAPAEMRRRRGGERECTRHPDHRKRRLAHLHFCRLRVATRLGDGLEVLVECPVGDVVAELFALVDGVAVVESDPDAGIDDLVLDVGDGVVVTCGRERGAAVGGAGDG